VHLRALKVSHKDALEVCPRMDAIHGEMLEPCSGTFCEVERHVLYDEEVIVRPPARQVSVGGCYQQIFTANILLKRKE
jgi:hypothetical protein